MQHRIAIGCNNCSQGSKRTLYLGGSLYCNFNHIASILNILFTREKAGSVWFTFTTYLLCVFYIYMLCLIMALVVDTTNSSAHFRKTPPPSHHQFSVISIVLSCGLIFSFYLV